MPDICALLTLAGAGSMTNVLIVARKEIQDGLRNRWVLATTILLAALALTLTFLGSVPTGSVGVRALDVVIVSLSSLTIFLVPLIALLISHDAIVGEMERGTMLLLLSYPIARWQVLLGKFIGHLAILGFATVIGYGAAVGALAMTGPWIDTDSLAAFAAMVGSSVLLGAVFIAVGYVISALVRDRGTAGGIAIGIWLLFVLIYDLALLGLLVVDQGQHISGDALNALLLANPTDVYRLFNLTGFANVSSFSGMAGIANSAALSPTTLLVVLVAWACLPLVLATFAFSRKEL
jgi:Cu-processing system permease protein